MHILKHYFFTLASIGIFTFFVSCSGYSQLSANSTMHNTSLPASGKSPKSSDKSDGSTNFGSNEDSLRYDNTAKTAEYLESIQDKEVLLRQFFAQMPKGADLHNHLTGSVYAETYYELACVDSLWVDTLSGKLYDKNTKDTISLFRLLPDHIHSNHALQVKLIDKWSVRNFHSYNYNIPQDEHFFNTFGLFGAATGKNMVALIDELKKRAVHENVQYLEIMGTSPSVSDGKINTAMGDSTYYRRKNDSLLSAINSTDTNQIRNVISAIVNEMNSKKAWKDEGRVYGNYIDSLDSASIEDTNLVTRYLSYASRNSDPLKVLAQLHIGFMASSDSSNKVVGVNIVSAENSEISMAHYTAHMLMFSVLNSVYPNVKTTLHAGELTMGLVKPEKLSSHIAQAVYIAKADRVGHGVDIAFEQSSSALLKHMRENSIPVEINLTSNEFILGVKDDAHPIILYIKAEVPLIISTDDAGILRTNLAEQYVLLVRRYGLTYYQIKQMVRNSIRYSFLKDDKKQEISAGLDSKLEAFESSIWR
ncbi:MAG: hypothetical protein LBI42_08300 [Chitinispirillales bacterium]|jgi:adenosine deaminase|nr:hypothetical protein [Chitinispirillales bacterium]